MNVQSSSSPRSRVGLPLFRLGFRPFYLLAALTAALLLPLWLWSLGTGWQPASGLAAMLWHAHEMLFGMMAAVVVGFLFTAGKNWTGLPTPHGAELAGLALLWLAARAAAVLAPYPVFFLLDVVFLPWAAIRFAMVLWRAGNRRNLGVAVVLGLMGVANLLFHLQAGGALASSPLWALHAGLAVLVVIESLIGGRVIPFFTRNATGRDTQVPAWREIAAMAALVSGLAAWLAGAPAWLTAMLLLAAAVLQAWRLLSWRPLAARGKPILWALHLAYAWVPVGLALLAMALWRDTTVSPAVHALAVGASGGLIIAMMTRTARGHTGRPLTVGRWETAAYLLVAAAALIRVFALYLMPAYYLPSLHLAGWLFAAAFAIYLAIYTPWLTGPRADGRAD